MSKLFKYARKLQTFILAMFSWDIPVGMEWDSELKTVGYLKVPKLNEIPKELHAFLPILIDEDFLFDINNKQIEIHFEEQQENSS